MTISQKKTGATGDLEMASGMSLDLQAKAADAASQKVAWSITEGSEYATITSSGMVKAVKDLTSAKTVKVKATATDGSNAAGEMTITIRPLAQGVQVYTEEGGRMLFSVRSTPSWWVRSNTTLEWDLSTQGSTIDLNSHVYPYYGDGEETADRNAMQGVTWKSSSPKIADVVDGQVVIYKTGTVTITATANDGSKQKVSFKLNVVRRITQLTLAKQTVAGGKSLDLSKLVTYAPTMPPIRNSAGRSPRAAPMPPLVPMES